MKHNYLKLQYLLFPLVSLFLTITAINKKSSSDSYEIVNQQITVDGNISDWNSIPSVRVRGENHLWIGEGLPEGKWQGNSDLSFEWRAAHNNGKLYFLFEVADDTLSDFSQRYSWLNDCIELHLDHQDIGGDRIIGIGPDNNLKDRLGKRLRGHEIHFLPANLPKAYFDDTKNIYYTDSDQTALFQKIWHGSIATQRTSEGYLIEVGFAIPNFYVQSGQKMGLDIAVCDDDGGGRKSLLHWSTYQGPFWITMDNFKNITIK